MCGMNWDLLSAAVESFVWFKYLISQDEFTNVRFKLGGAVWYIFMKKRKGVPSFYSINKGAFVDTREGL